MHPHADVVRGDVRTKGRDAGQHAASESPPGHRPVVLVERGARAVRRHVPLPPARPGDGRHRPVPRRSRRASSTSAPTSGSGIPPSYPLWYGRPHPRPDLLERFVYGIPELHREEMASAAWVSSAGCNATAVILALHPLFRLGLVDPSGRWSRPRSARAKAARRRRRRPTIRSAAAASGPTSRPVIGMSAEMVAGTRRGGGGDDSLLGHGGGDGPRASSRPVTSSCKRGSRRSKTIWQVYRQAYGGEPFIRIVKARDGVHRFPEPKLLSGSNFCDIGFERDPRGNRLVVMSAIDNLMKGAAGQAVQAFNIMHGLRGNRGPRVSGPAPDLTAVRGPEPGLDSDPCADCWPSRAASVRDRRPPGPVRRDCQEQPRVPGRTAGDAPGRRAARGGRTTASADLGGRPLAVRRAPGCSWRTPAARFATRASRSRTTCRSSKPPFAFVFNGELRGVRIAEVGRIGAEKLFRFLVRRGAGESEAGLRTAVRLVGQRTRYVRAMNFVLGRPGAFLVCSSFNEDHDYFTLHARRAEGVAVGLLEAVWEPLRMDAAAEWRARGDAVVLVKIGGGAAINLDGIAADLAAMPGPVVVVHGANALRDRLAAALGKEKRVVTSVSGYASVYSDDDGHRPADDGLRRPRKQADRRAAAAARPERHRADRPRRPRWSRVSATRASACARARRRCSCATSRASRRP